ncbi:glycine-rich domain-containing protein [Rhodococcus sp. 5G237]
MTYPVGGAPDGAWEIGTVKDPQGLNESSVKSIIRGKNLPPWENAQGQQKVFSYGIDREVVRLDNRIDDIVLGGQQAQLMTCSASTTWVKPPGARKVVVDVMGGSSGGGRATMSGNSKGGYGGYSGGWYTYEFNAADLPASVPVIVGRGGSGATSNGHGAAGEDSRFGDYVLATGAGPNSYGSGNKTFRMRGGNGWNGERTQDEAMSALPAPSGSSGSFSQGGAGGAYGENGQTGASVPAQQVGMGSSGGGGGGGGGGLFGSTTPGRGGHGGWPSGAGGGGGGGGSVPSANGGNAAGGAVFITTYIVPDISDAPTVPTNLVANNITETSATLTWTAATDDVAVTEYEVYVNGLLWGSTATITFELTGLVKATNYQVEVKAVDEHGFRSDPAAIPVLTAGGTPLPPQIVGVATGGYVNPGIYTTYDIPVPAHNPLDMLVLIVGTRDNASVNTPFGWTQAVVASGSESPQRLYVFTKFASPNESAAVAVQASTAQKWQGAIVAVRNATAVDAVAGATRASTQGTQLPAVTTTKANTVILYGVATSASEFRSKTWSGAPELSDHGEGSTNENGVSLSTAGHQMTNAGVSPLVSVTTTGAAGTAAVVTIALK